MVKRKILITGAYGLVGNLIFNHLSQEPDAYEVFGLDRSPNPSNRINPEDVTSIPVKRFYQVDLNDLVGLKQAVSDKESVIHMAADSGNGNWESILQNNIIGLRNLFEICRETGVKRVVLASTVMVNLGYRSDEPYKAIMEGRFKDVPLNFRRITKEDPTRPTGIYAVSKVWGEELGFMYAYNYGLSCLCLRIGWVVAENRPRPNYGHSVWCSFRDICQLIQKCVDAPDDLLFDIFYGFSNNKYRLADIEHAYEVLGYNPQDCSEDFD